MVRVHYSPGDEVIYRKFKHSNSPGPRARAIDPSPHGEDYTYEVDKFWAVIDVREDSVVLATRRGKQHVVAVDDENLRHARWWEKLMYRDRFPDLEALHLSAGL